MKTCADCDRPIAHDPQRIETHTPVPLKQNGYVGDTFVPWDKTHKSWPKITARTVCGLCYVSDYARTMPDGPEREEIMLQMDALLLQVAKDEAAARTATPKRSPAKGKRPKPTRHQRNGARRNGHALTSANAANFDSISEANATVVDAALTCACQPYLDVLTYDRWRALGRQVRHGQHGIRINRGPTVFCKCQTDALEVTA